MGRPTRFIPENKDGVFVESAHRRSRPRPDVWAATVTRRGTAFEQDHAVHDDRGGLCLNLRDLEPQRGEGM